MQYGSANFSRCNTYRYLLTRSVKESHPEPSVTFVMLNPAKADALTNDQTIGKCVGFAQRWGMQTLQVVNLFGYCTSFQDELYAAADPTGPSNQRWLKKVLRETDKVVCAWGKGAPEKEVHSLQRLVDKHSIDTFCLGVNQDGSPKHPARIGYARQLVPFEISPQR